MLHSASAAAAWILWHAHPALADTGFVPAKIQLDQAPDQSKYDAADEKLRDAAGKLQLALNAEDVQVSLALQGLSDIPSLCSPLSISCEPILSPCLQTTTTQLGRPILPSLHYLPIMYACDQERLPITGRGEALDRADQQV